MKVEFVNTERALSPTSIDLADFVINPYKGCQVGCAYCYARSNKGLKKSNDIWGESVSVKKNFLELLEKDIQKIGPENIGKVLIGSTAEVFQPIEQEYHLTENTLKILKKYQIPFVLLTKMNGIVNFLDLLDYSEKNTIYFTYNHESVRTLFEKRSFPQIERLKVIQSIFERKIRLNVYISPVFPGITDVQLVFEELKGKTDRIYFEAYNPRLGNWDEIRLKLPDGLISEYERIFFQKEDYKTFWNDFKANTDRLNGAYGYKIQYFIYPFGEYYNVPSVV